MSEEFKIEIVNPEKSFLSKEDVTEVVVPAFEGEMGILKDHISIISFLKFKNNNLSVLTSSIFDIKDADKDKINELLKQAEDQIKNNEITDQNKYLIDQKIDVLKTLN